MQAVCHPVAERQAYEMMWKCADECKLRPTRRRTTAVQHWTAEPILAHEAMRRCYGATSRQSAKHYRVRSITFRDAASRYHLITDRDVGCVAMVRVLAI